MDNNCVRSIPIQVKGYGPENVLPCVNCYLDLGDRIIGQDHDTPLDHGQQLCEILFRSNLAVRSYARTRIKDMYAL